ncbi:hypothetical protein, partial [Brevundimonas sp. GN22]
IEPVTPTMSTNGITGKSEVFQSPSSPFVLHEFRSCPAFHGRIMGADTKNPGSLAGETGAVTRSMWGHERGADLQGGGLFY